MHDGLFIPCIIFNAAMDFFSSMCEQFCALNVLPQHAAAIHILNCPKKQWLSTCEMWHVTSVNCAGLYSSVDPDPITRRVCCNGKAIHAVWWCLGRIEIEVPLYIVGLPESIFNQLNLCMKSWCTNCLVLCIAFKCYRVFSYVTTMK